MIDPMMQMMYTDALMGLASGYVDDISRDILSYAPLPSEYTDPFAAQDTDPASVMKMTGTAMTAWIEEARKADYFSKHFIQLSKMIMNGTVTMARGLMSLHNRGEDLSQAPMSVGDLISLGSYHFRKSYLGVLQTVKSQPEISQRLLMNQIGWANTLLRLYKTKEKLETPVVLRPAPAELPGEDHKVLEAAPQELPQESTPKALKASEEQAYGDLAAIFEPGCYAAPRAYSSLDGSPAPRTAKRIADPVKAETPDPDTEKKESKTVRKAETITGTAKPTSENKAEVPEAEEKNEIPETETEMPEGKEETAAVETAETVSEAPAESENEDPADEAKAEDQQFPENGETWEPGEQPPEDRIPDHPPDEDPPDEEDPPQWFRILSRAYARGSTGGQEGIVNFTDDEILFLINDPEFCAFFPEMAEKMRNEE